MDPLSALYWLNVKLTMALTRNALPQVAHAEH